MTNQIVINRLKSFLLQRVDHSDADFTIWSLQRLINKLGGFYKMDITTIGDDSEPDSFEISVRLPRGKSINHYKSDTIHNLLNCIMTICNTDLSQRIAPDMISSSPMELWTEEHITIQYTLPYIHYGS